MADNITHFSKIVCYKFIYSLIDYTTADGCRVSFQQDFFYTFSSLVRSVRLIYVLLILIYITLKLNRSCSCHFLSFSTSLTINLGVRRATCTTNDCMFAQEKNQKHPNLKNILTIIQVESQILNSIMNRISLKLTYRF